MRLARPMQLSRTIQAADMVDAKWGLLRCAMGRFSLSAAQIRHTF
jgi:hypothetical protein